MKPKYMLEIYTSAGGDAEATFESDTPFMNINIGDLLHPAFFETSDLDKQKKLLRVLRLEHIIWKTQNIVKHKICVYTKLVENNENEREK